VGSNIKIIYYHRLLWLNEDLLCLKKNWIECFQEEKKKKFPIQELLTSEVLLQVMISHLKRRCLLFSPAKFQQIPIR